MASERFLFVTPVWGYGHVKVFIEVGLLSLLSPGNLPGMRSKEKSSYLIFTRALDFVMIEKSLAFQQLQSLMEVQVVFVEEGFDSPHALMSDCHREGLKKASASGAGVVFIPPECLWADGSMTNLERIVMDDVSMVHMTGLRVDREAMSLKIGNFRAQEGTSLEIQARDLVKLGMTCLHPITDDLFFRERSTKLMPANLLWTVKDQGILARCFHLHPLFVKATERCLEFKTTIDDDLALVSDPLGKKDYIVTDSDEIFAYELSPLSHKVTANYDKGSVTDIAAWAEVGTNDRHRQLIQTPIRLHFTDVDPEAWKPIEREASEVVVKVDKLLNSSLWYLLIAGTANNVLYRVNALKNQQATELRPKIPLYDYILHFAIEQCLKLNLRWQLYNVRHYIKYYLKRIVHHFRWHLYNGCHHMKYYAKRAMHYLKTHLYNGCHRMKYYSGRISQYLWD